MKNLTNIGIKFVTRMMLAHSTIQFLLLVATGSSLFLHVQCKPGGESSRVLNGTPLYKHEIPWLTPIFNSSKTESQCTGSIIGKYHVLTAAHCNLGDVEWVATAGAHKASEVESFNKIVKFQYLRNGEAYDIYSAPDREEEKAKWILNPLFGMPSPGIDIAVLTLKDEIQFKPGVVEKAKLAPLCNSCCPRCSKGCDIDFTVAGWGNDPADPEQIGGTSDIPKKTTLVCNENEKSDDYHYFNAIDKFDPKGKDVCGGDSGGPVMNKNVIYGTVVSGYICTYEAPETGRSGKYANVRQQEIQRFIKSIVFDVEIEGQ